jgi:hypothetical protein
MDAHGATAAKDLDILIGADAENSKAAYAALAKFGASVDGPTAKDFTDLDGLFRMRTIAQHRENEQSQSPTEGSRAFETMKQTQERGVEEWLKRRHRQPLDGKMPTLEEIQAKGQEEWMRYREQQNEKSRHPNDNSEGKDSPIDSDHEGLRKKDLRKIDDDLGF